MFDYLQLCIITILISALVIVISGVIYYGYARRQRDRHNLRDNLKCISIVFGFVIFIILFIVIFGALFWWGEATSLPFEYQAACATVDEIKDLITDENATIGKGLEALELKQSIKDAIEHRNNLRADIYAWLYNPFMPYKGAILERLSPDFFD